MKRFISEYATYKINDYKSNDLMNVDIKSERIEAIQKAVSLCERGFITIDESIRIINNN